MSRLASRSRLGGGIRTRTWIARGTTLGPCGRQCVASLGLPIADAVPAETQREQVEAFTYARVIPTLTCMLHAFIDEAGQRSATTAGSDHFVMSAVLVRDTRLAEVKALQADLRRQLRRQPDQQLHWNQLRRPADRVTAAAGLGGMPVKIVSVVVFKRHLKQLPHENLAYMFTFRMLLERLSWIAGQENDQVTYTLAHVRRFPLWKLRQYESNLRSDPGSINWFAIRGLGKVDQPRRIEQLQLADIAASATFRAFEPDDRGKMHPEYVQSFAHRLYKRPPGLITSYGLKFHPSTDATRAAHPWVAAL